MLLQVASQLFQLARCLRADKNALALTHGVPKVAAVLGDATGQGIGVAIVLHLGSRARRIQRDREVMSASGARAPSYLLRSYKESRTLGDRGHRRCPAQRAERASASRPVGGTLRSAMARRLYGQEVPGVHEAPMVIALGIAAARRTEELLLGLAHRPKASEQFVHEKALLHG